MKYPGFIALLLLLLLTVVACRNSHNEADMIFINARVYTLDSAFSTAEAFAVKDGRIIAVGSNAEITAFSHKAQTDLRGKPVYPGFYDAHCHFYGYAIDLEKIWLVGSGSYASILDSLNKHRERRFMGWVFGRGWDQNDWEDKRYPDRTALDSMFPDVPVFLMRIDGHAALVNAKALSLAGITADTRVEGGEVEVKNGKPTGLLIDNAVDLVKKLIPEPAFDVQRSAMLKAQANCIAKGLTSLVDAGLDHRVIQVIDSIHRTGDLKIRLNCMASYSPDNVAYYRKAGPYRSDRLRVKSFKLYADGALGSRGACLLHQYADLPGHHGFLLYSIDSIRQAAQTVADMGFQLNTHCIGDSANRLLLDIYGSVLKGKNDLRWRIEHAQVMNPSDFHLFRDFSIIPSVQPAHATSDMYWAGNRLGQERVRGAYAYRQLLEQNGMLAAGSDFPVEDINPLYGFYAAVVRKDQKGLPEGGFQKENAISREQALKAMTIWAAYSVFEEDERGSLEKGKMADFVVLDEDLMTAPDEALFNIKVRSTWIGGEKVYDAD